MSTTPHAATIARVRTSHSDMGTSGGQRGRSAAAASTAGAVMSRVSVTMDGPPRGGAVRAWGRYEG
ncbi:hypothetical protein DCW30_02550 [Streptomyces alfalfae]|nr:hypothetical protein D3X13_03150 [Streptomyces fradiae]RXX47414.1 hypothetical protein DCW30_02550 [Streptomyces alfalfae]RZM91951.1 hypothetical protein D4104_22530 [Streptomyces alfalfae]THC43771.1 hypothetical protein E7X58_34375 [Streptomyces sp. A1499]